MRTFYKILFVLVFKIYTNSVFCDSQARSSKSFQNTFEQAERGGRTCHDFCAMIPTFCRNGGTCVTDENNCTGRCMCSPGWTGLMCQEQDGTTEGDEEFQKNQNFENELHKLGEVTVTGSEPSRFIKQVPDEFFKEVRGTLMNQLETSTKTSLKVRSMSDTSKLNESWNPVIDRTVRDACEKNCNGGCVKINGGYTCKNNNTVDSSIPKVCGPGFVCVHGVCDLEALKNNSYKCICERSYVGQFCTKLCPLECGKHGRCDIHVPDSTYKCFCEWNYTGRNCSELIPEESELVMLSVHVHWYVIGVAVIVIIMAVTAVLIGGYCMWRRRLVFMLKIVHYFQNYEEDDGKEYDAFVSYKSSPRDEEFVLKQLYPKLELEQKFKLCLHFRDFIPGEAIANNIVRAIESSRRTIMILSPDYVQSEWCRMEYQTAQHEMLKLKHKIIPVVLEDISKVTDIDKNLKSIIGSVTYIEWPGLENNKKTDRFWRKLQLSLPKKSTLTEDSTSKSTSVPSETETDTTSSELVTSISPSSHISSAVTQHSATDSPTLSSTTTDSDSSKKQKKRKDFKHFMDKLVHTKLFGRQDSSSSQAALVDDETFASRSSCGSVSDSMLSESTESICSTPDTSRSSLHDTDELKAQGSLLSSCASELDLRTHQRGFQRNNLRYVSLPRKAKGKYNKRRKELARNKECEKDHCDDVVCSSCNPQNLELGGSQELSTQSFINRGFREDNEADIVCLNCEYLRKKSDNNRIRISPIDGSNQIRIQKLPRECITGTCCDHVTENENYFGRSDLFRGSIKEHKDARNLEIAMKQKLNRIGSLPRNYKSSHTYARKQALNAEDLCVKANGNVSNYEGSSTCYLDLYENV